jgi:hypothetical protein
MRHLETIKGQGTMTSNAGEQVAVRYELHVYQDEIHAGTQDNPGGTIPGMKNIRGKGATCALFRREWSDPGNARWPQVEVFFTDLHGAMTVNSWID